MGLRLLLSIHLSGYRHHPRYRYFFLKKKHEMFFQSQIFFVPLPLEMIRKIVHN